MKMFLKKRYVSDLTLVNSDLPICCNLITGNTCQET